TPAPRAQLGLRIRWMVYRAPESGGQVTFEPETSRPTLGALSAELETQATFSAPGVYWLQAVGSDGLLQTPYDVKITLKGRQGYLSASPFAPGAEPPRNSLRPSANVRTFPTPRLDPSFA